MGENPFIPYPFYYDIVTWSYGMQRGLAGSGFLVDQSSVPTDMTQVGTPDFGGAPAQPSSVYAFEADSAKALALIIDLLGKNVEVHRATQAFTTAEGNGYLSGAALVDGPSLARAGVDLNALAKARQTPVTGLAAYPVATQEMTAPKIGLYTGGPTIPANPLYRRNTGNPSLDGHCATSTQAGASQFCEALFTLRVKDGLPESAIVPITQTQVDAGELVSGKYTALINPNLAIPADVEANPNATPPVAADPSETAAGIRDFVNAGGRYVGYGVNGALAGARNAKITRLGSTPLPSTMRTPGSTYDATFDTSDPTAWGFEQGGWIYRTTSNEPMFDPATLTAGNGYGAAEAIVSYATDLHSDASLKGQKYGLSVNATGPGLLDGRPAVVGTNYGQGRATFFGWNPFFRAWKDQDERLVLNAALYPTTAVQPPRAGTRVTPEAVAEAPVALTAATTKETGTPVPAATIAKAKAPKKVKKQHDVTRDFQLVVAKKYVSKLKKAVKAAKLPKSLRSKVSYKQTGKKTKLVTFTIKNARGDDFHDRHDWVDRLMRQVKKQGVKLKVGQL
jgi:hypothetical protein